MKKKVMLCILDGWGLAKNTTFRHMQIVEGF